MGSKQVLGHTQNTHKNHQYELQRSKKWAEEKYKCPLNENKTFNANIHLQFTYIHIADIYTF